MKKSIHEFRRFLFATIMLLGVGVTAWGADFASVGTILWGETFESTTGAGGDVALSTYDYSGRTGYSTNAITYSVSNVSNGRWSNSSATGVTDCNLWLKKQTQVEFTTSAINLFGAEQVTFEFTKSKSKLIVSWSSDGANWTEIYSDASAVAVATASPITIDIPDGVSSIYIKLKEGNNSNNCRVDNLALKVTKAGTNPGDTRSELTTFEWSAETATATIGEAFSAPTLTVAPSVSGIVYSSKNTDVAEIDEEGNVTLKAKGETVIKAAFAGNTDYKAASAEYTLTVSTAPISSAWDLVTTAPTSWEGEYIIVAKPSAESRVLLNGAQTSFSTITPLSLTSTEFTEEDGLLTIKTEEDPSFVISSASTAGQYNIKGAGGTWLGGTSGGASLTSNKSNWVFELQSGGDVFIRVYAESMTRALLYRNTSTFQHYATSNVTSNGYYRVYLYKKHDGTTPVKTLTGIVVKTEPKKVYTEGENFDPTGLEITATYDDETSVDVAYADATDKFTFVPALTATLATTDTKVTITYGGQSVDQAITVNEITKYAIAIASGIDNGNVSVSGSLTEAAEGATITLTAEPADGYEFTSWNVTNASTSAAIDVVDNKFTMPAAAVNVSAVFTATTGGDESDDIVLTFVESGTNSDASSAYASVAAAFGDDATAVVSAISVNRVYPARTGRGAKFGGSNNCGSITITLKETVNVSKIIVSAAGYSTSDYGKVSINGTEYSTTSAASVGFETFTKEYSTPEALNKITIAGAVGSSSTNYRIYVQSITIVLSDEPIKVVTGIAVKTAPTKVEYTEGENFDPAGLEITATYDDETSVDVAYADATDKFTFAPALTAALATTDAKVTITFGGQSVDQTITVNAAVVKSEQTLTFAESSYSFDLNEEVTDFTNTLSGANTAVTYESSNTAVATVDAAGLVHVVTTAEGTATITATAAETEDYLSATKSYTIKVVDPSKLSEIFAFSSSDNGITLNALGEASEPGGNVEAVKGNITVTSAGGRVAAGAALQIYKTQTMTVTAATGYAITGVDFTYATSCYPFSEAIPEGTDVSSNKTATGKQDASFVAVAPVTSITFTNVSGGQTKVNKMVVYYKEYTVPKFTITPATCENGSVSADVEKAEAGATVTLTATPADGYELEAWNVNGVDETAISVTDNKFTMPAQAVSVSASFVVKTSFTSPNLGYETFGLTPEGTNTYAQPAVDKNTITFDGITLTTVKNSGTEVRFDETFARLYQKNDLVIAAPAGKAISKVVLNKAGGDWKSGATVAPACATYVDTDDAPTWTGEAKKVIFSFGGTHRLASVTVTLADYVDPTYELTITNDFGTMYWDENWTVEPGVEVYYGNWNEALGCIDLHQYTGTVVPANEGVIVRAIDQSSVILTATAAEADGTIDGNEFKGSVTGATRNKDANVGTYVYSKSLGAFTRYTGETIPAYRAYMEVEAPAGAGAPQSVRMRIVNTTTDIESANADVNVQKQMINGQLFIIRDGKMYNVQGVLVK